MNALRPISTCAVLLLGMATACADAPPRADPDRAALPRIERPAGLAEWETGIREGFEERHANLERSLEEPQATMAEIADAYGRLGMWLHTYKRRELALVCYRAARELAPEEARWSYYLGRIYTDQSQSELAGAAFRAVLEQDPKDIPSLILLAEIEIAAGRNAEAESFLETAIAVRPEEARTQARLGQLALVRREYTEALKWLQQAEAGAPDRGEIQYSIGVAYRGLGELDRARQHLERAVAGRGPAQPFPMTDPRMLELAQLRDDSAVHDLRGQQAFKAGRYAEAAEEFRKAVAAAPQRPGPRQNLASALLEMGELDGARQTLREVLEVAPDSAEAHFYLGALLTPSETRGQAEQHLRQAIALDPQMKRAHKVLALLLEADGRTEEALRHQELSR